MTDTKKTQSKTGDKAQSKKKDYPEGSEPIIIKKYANRRLYNMAESKYVTLEDLAKMIREGDDFVVYDAKSGEDITRSILTQIIFEEEGEEESYSSNVFLKGYDRFLW